MKTYMLILIALACGATISSADVLGEWTFDAGSSSAERRAASGLAAGVAGISALEFNTFDDVGVGSVPASVHDGIGFGGNSGELVAFIHRANYFDGGGPVINDFTSFGSGSSQGTAAGIGDGNAPVSFSVTAAAGTRLYIQGLKVEWVNGDALIVGFQEAGEAAGATVTLNGGNKIDSASLDAPVVVDAGETKTFTVSLNSGVLDSKHNINAFQLNGFAIPTAGIEGKTAGVFYSTLYAYDPAYRMTRITGFGTGAEQRLFADVDGDGMDDALAIFQSALDASQDVWRVEAALSDGSDFVNPLAWLSWTNATGTETAMPGDVDGDGDEDLVFFRNNGGTWNVALSTGSGFEAPVLWSSGNGAGSDHQFLEDMDGDGKADAVISWKTWNGGDWRSGLSGGSGFGAFGIQEQAFGDGLVHYVSDLNADGKADLIALEETSGTWDISINVNPDFIQTLAIETGFGTDAEFTTVYDVDNNGSGDLVYVDGNEGWVRYLNNNLSLVNPRHRWITQGRSKWRELYADAKTDIASMDGSGNGQLFCSYNGMWQAFPPNAQKNTTLRGETVNTWEVWPNHYLPWHPTNSTPNTYGYYDSGDPAVNDAQIRQIHDFGFNYIQFDITNGGAQWVNNRALAFIDRIRHWNENLQAGQRKMYFCIALGRTRGLTDESAFFNKLEDECIMAWDQFYADNLDMVWFLDGKPLLIHMLDGNAQAFWPNLGSWAGPRTYIDLMTNRTFRNWDLNSGDAAYGWVIPDDNPDHDPNLMTVMPGFSNKTSDHSHNNGLRYKSHWLRVLKADPQSVFVVSWNEDWEQNAIQPAFMHRSPLEAEWKPGKGYAGLEAYTDELGAQMDDYYYAMTRQYLKLFQSGFMEEGTYFKEESSPDVYQSTATGFVHQGSMPSQAPVLVLPDGFVVENSGYVAFSNLYALAYGPLGHDDTDGLDNLSEYALGGNPTNNDAASILSTFQSLENYFYYIHNERTDDTNLSYTVQLSTNLVTGIWKTNGVEFVDESGVSNIWKSVTNRTDIGEREFMRLKIEQL